MNGEGAFIFNNGERYEGTFTANMKQGNGNYYYINGDIFKGTFAKGQIVNGKMYFINRDEYYIG